MPLLHSFLVNAHIAVGALALILFWVPVLARKGGRTHVTIGRIYVFAMYTVAVTAFVTSVMVLTDPIGIRLPEAELAPERAAEIAEQFRVFATFLFMLSILVFASLRHGILALRERASPGALRSGVHRVLLGSLVIAAITVGVVGIEHRQILLMIFSVIGIAGGLEMLRETRRDMSERRNRMYVHLNSLIGTGIGAYTAFFAFGGSRLLIDLLPGQWQTIPWILPFIIGTIAISRLRRRYGL